MPPRRKCIVAFRSAKRHFRADGPANTVGRQSRHGWESRRHGSTIDHEIPARGVLSASAWRRGPSRWIASLREDRQELIRFWPVVQNMVVQELRVRYQRSFLGFVWTLLNPILMMAILSWVFSHLMERDAFPHYPLFLFAGMVPWSFLSISLSDCAFAIINNEGLIRKIYLPKMVFPLARVLIALVTFLLTLSALFVLLFPLGARPSFSLLFLPVAIGLLAAFTLGLGLIVATLNTFYRDCGHLIAVVLQAWYFATPILFPIETVRDRPVVHTSQSGVFVHRDLSRHFVYGAMAPDRPGRDRRGDRGGKLGNRVCHIQVSRRQDGLSTLIGARRPGPRRAAGSSLIELNDVSLRFVNYADKQYSLKRAVLDLVLRRDAPVPTAEFWALSRVTLKIDQGERVGIVGGNGAGKSTLLRLLARIYPATSGHVAIRGSASPR